MAQVAGSSTPLMCRNPGFRRFQLPASKDPKQNTEIDEPFSLCVVPTAFKGLVDKLKGSRHLDVSFPTVRGMKRLCFNADTLQLVDPKAKLFDASKADQLLIDVTGDVWTARVGVQHLLNSLRPVAMAAADPEQNRAMAKATLRFSDSMEFSAEATDGRILVRAEGLLTFFSKESAELVLSTATLNRLVSLLKDVPQADTVTLQLVKTELDGAPAGQMLSVAFREFHGGSVDLSRREAGFPRPRRPCEVGQGPTHRQQEER